MQEQRLRADRRRDRGDAGLVPGGRIRPGRLHRGRGGAQGHANRRDHSARATFCSASLPTGCIPMAIRWRASCCSRSLSCPLDRRPRRRTAEGAPQLSEADSRFDRRRLLKGAAHITGGGITDNTPRILPAGLAARIDVSTWTIPPLFEKLRAIGNIDLADYRRTFNLGIGMILVVAKRNLARKARTILEKPGRDIFRDRQGGRIIARSAG